MPRRNPKRPAVKVENFVAARMFDNVDRSLPWEEITHGRTLSCAFCTEAIRNSCKVTGLSLPKDKVCNVSDEVFDAWKKSPER